MALCCRLKKSDVDAYRKCAELTSAVHKEHGALDYSECLGDDLTPSDETSNFIAMAGAGEDETVVFTWIVYASREARDAANTKVAADPRMAELFEKPSLPFDCKRMAFGGFTQLVHA